jgi:hypothetical protein
MEKNRRGFSMLDFGLPIGRRGQSLIEYLVVATAVILGILAFRANVQANVTTLGNEAVDRIDETQTTINTEVTPIRR